jgi:hypothetical protein
MVLVGDRGMLTQGQITALTARPGLGWITALRGEKVRQLCEQRQLQLSPFDEQNLAEIRSPAFPAAQGCASVFDGDKPKEDEGESGNRASRLPCRSCRDGSGSASSQESFFVR